MRVKDLMVKEVVTVAPETSLKDVATILAERGISGLPVVDGGKVVGVVSEADILMKAQAPEPTRGALGRLLHPQSQEEVEKLGARTAGEAMSSPAVTIDAVASIAEAASLMVQRGINRLPVVENGRLAGILTRADVVRAFTRDDAELAREIREDVILKKFWIAPETVTVGVENGEVTLGGEVERQSVAELLASYIEHVPGVVSVHSTLSWREADRP
jgi:CBS domain-containing protein